MKTKPPIFVFGVYGHTDQFVFRELEQRGGTVWASGRDGFRLSAVAARSDSRALSKAIAVTDAAGLIEAAREGPRPSSIALGRFRTRETGDSGRQDRWGAFTRRGFRCR
jgi:hypothetical protein